MATPAGSQPLHPRRVEGRSPAAFAVPRELEVEALMRHADRDPSDSGPGVEPGTKRPEGAGIRWPGKPSEAGVLLAGAGHLLDNLVCLQQEGLRNRDAESLGSLEVDHQLELRRLLDGEIGGLGPLEDLVQSRPCRSRPGTRRPTGCSMRQRGERRGSAFERGGSAGLVSPASALGPAWRWLQRRTARVNPITPPITKPANVAPRMTRAKGAANCQKRNETVTACAFWRATTATVTATTVRTIRKGMVPLFVLRDLPGGRGNRTPREPTSFGRT